jgi:hypothetical protein
LSDKVISKAFDGGVGVAGNSGLGVVADDDGLLGLGNGETCPALMRN